MSSNDRRRDRPQFFNLLGLERPALADAPDALGGADGALVSLDEASGSRTWVVELPRGWRRELDGRDASLELVTLSGDLALEGDRIGAGGYVHAPQGGGGGELRSEGGSLALVFWNPNLPSYPPPYTTNRVLRLRELEWVSSLRGGHGAMHKSLRLPDPIVEDHDGGPGGYLRVMYLEPGIQAPFEHVHHECFEEIAVLSGDCLLAHEGELGPGSFCSHPQEWWHGLFASRAGAVIVVQTDAPMGWPWPPRDHPFAAEICAAYLDETDVHEPAVHRPWARTPWSRYTRTPEFERWRASADGEEFADAVGRDAASRFRASWRRQS